MVIEDPYTPIAPTGRYRKALPIHTKKHYIGPTGGYRMQVNTTPKHYWWLSKTIAIAQHIAPYAQPNISIPMAVIEKH